MSLLKTEIPSKHRATRFINDDLGNPVIDIMAKIYRQYHTEDEEILFRETYHTNRNILDVMQLHSSRKMKQKGFKIAISERTFEIRRNPSFLSDFPKADQVYDIGYTGKLRKKNEIWRIERIK